MLALTGTYAQAAFGGAAAAYGIVADAPYDALHLEIWMENGGGACGGLAVAGTVQEVTFDEADIFGTFHEAGHPGVIGLWLNDLTIGSTIDPNTIDPASYVVPDLQPDRAGWMFVRGYVWPPGERKQPYP